MVRVGPYLRGEVAAAGDDEVLDAPAHKEIRAYGACGALPEGQSCGRGQ